jgi:hypothetical protein
LLRYPVVRLPDEALGPHDHELGCRSEQERGLDLPLVAEGDEVQRLRRVLPRMSDAA